MSRFWWFVPMTLPQAYISVKMFLDFYCRVGINGMYYSMTLLLLRVRTRQALLLALRDACMNE
jgi:hypothetical protein